MGDDWMMDDWIKYSREIRPVTHTSTPTPLPNSRLPVPPGRYGADLATAYLTAHLTARLLGRSRLPGSDRLPLWARAGRMVMDPLGASISVRLVDESEDWWPRSLAQSRG